MRRMCMPDLLPEILEGAVPSRETDPELFQMVHIISVEALD